MIIPILKKKNQEKDKSTNSPILETLSNKSNRPTSSTNLSSSVETRMPKMSKKKKSIIHKKKKRIRHEISKI